VVPERVRRALRKTQAALVDVYSQRSRSQEGEDTFKKPEEDLPRRFSNTCALYRLGWSGINIDATPGAMRPFAGNDLATATLKQQSPRTDEISSFNSMKSPL